MTDFAFSKFLILNGTRVWTREIGGTSRDATTLGFAVHPTAAHSFAFGSTTGIPSPGYGLGQIMWNGMITPSGGTSGDPKWWISTQLCHSVPRAQYCNSPGAGQYPCATAECPRASLVQPCPPLSYCSGDGLAVPCPDGVYCDVVDGPGAPCDPAFTGPNCTACVTNHCVNAGICYRSQGDVPSCMCPLGFSGLNCQTNIVR